MHVLEHHLHHRWPEFTTQRLVVAVSGGPDSLALLVALSRIVPTAHLHVFHLDHGWRGDQSAAEAQFVRQTAEQLGVAHTIAYVAVPQLMPHPNSSAASRLVRYQHLAMCALATHAQQVLVAHTRDDQAETVLMHLLRGSGSTGLAGMRPQIPWQQWAPTDLPQGEALLTRPLLDIDRTIIADYCRVHHLTPTDDPSNHKRSAQRVRMRHDILPQLRAEQPNLNLILARTAQHMADQEDALRHVLTQQWHLLTTPYQHGTLLLRQPLQALPVALQRTAIRMALLQHYHHLRDLSWDHIESIRASLLHGHGLHTPPPQPFQVGLHPDGVVIAAQPLSSTANKLQFFGTAQPLYEQLVVACGAYTLTCTLTSQAPASTPWRIPLPLGNAYTLRTRQAGDRISIGHQQRRRIQDVMVDAKIPASARGNWPLVVHADDVVWIPGVRTAPEHVARVGSPALLCSIAQNQV